MSNEALKTHLAKLEDLRVSAKSRDDIPSIVEEIKEYSKSGSYTFQQPFVIYLLFISFFLTLIIYANSSSDEGLMLAGASFIVFIGSVFAFFSKKKQVKNAGRNLGHTALALANNLVPNEAFNGRELWKDLKRQFRLFRTGDESQEITALYDGKTEDGAFFQLFEFKYVDVTEEEDEDSDGNKTTTKRRTTHYEYGVLIHMPSLPLMTINTRSQFKEKWDSASKEFNKKFKIRCSNPVETAKFFNPACVLKFEESFKNIRYLDMTPSSYVCISAKSDIFPKSFGVPHIKKTDEYISYLSVPPKIEALRVLRDFVDYSNSRSVMKKEAV